MRWLLLLALSGAATALAWADVRAFLSRHMPGLISRGADAAKAGVDVAADVGTLVASAVLNNTGDRNNNKDQ